MRSLAFNAFHLFCEWTIHGCFDSLLPPHRHNVAVYKIDFSASFLRDIRSHRASIRYQSLFALNAHQQFVQLPTEHELCSLRHPASLRIAPPRGLLRLRPTLQRKASKNIVADTIVFWQRQDFAVSAVVDSGERIDHSVHDQFLPQNFFELELIEGPRLTLFPPNSAGRWTDWSVFTHHSADFWPCGVGDTIVMYPVPEWMTSPGFRSIAPWEVFPWRTLSFPKILWVKYAINSDLENFDISHTVL